MIKTKIFSKTSLLLIILTNFLLAVNICWAENNSELIYTTSFVSTAYYSPLEGQRAYVTGNLTAEKRLNGNGTNGANGTEVLFGMLAAPRTYPFGTKIFIPWLGLWTVQDRGGAIKNNRLDIWVGRGEEGLARALTWGIRKFEGTVYLPGAIIPDEILAQTITSHKIPNVGFDYVLPKLINRQIAPNGNQSYNNENKNQQYFLNQIKNEFLLDRSYGLNQEDERIKQIKLFMKELGYPQTDSNIFDETLYQSLLKYQLNNQLFESASSRGAGRFGKKTYSQLLQDLSTKRLLAWENSQNNSLPKINFNLDLKYSLFDGFIGPEVKEISKYLKMLGYQITESNEYNEEIKNTIIKFQFENGIIDSKDSEVAGYFWPKTIAKMKEIIKQKEKNQQLYYEGQDMLVVGNNYRTITYNSFDPENLEILTTLKIGDKNNEVTKLKQKLNYLGYLNSKYINDYFDLETSNALFFFQKDQQIVFAPTDYGAGYVWPKTKQYLNDAKLEQKIYLN